MPAAKRSIKNIDVCVCVHGIYCKYALGNVNATLTPHAKTRQPKPTKKKERERTRKQTENQVNVLHFMKI